MLHQNRPQQLLRFTIMSLSSLLILLVLLILLKLGVAPVAAAQDDATHPATILPLSSCARVVNVSVFDCIALVELYTSTEGLQWVNQKNWLNFESATGPCSWYGVICTHGRVTELHLPGNGLSGTLPLSFGHLTGLVHLRLEQNRLRGPIPSTICQLAANLRAADLAYNALFTQRADVERCLQQLDPDWQMTQTGPVTHLRVSDLQANSLRLSWQPISYTADGGYYEIALSDSSKGPFIPYGRTADKSVSTYLVDGLEPGRTYHFQVRAYTPPHQAQPNELWGRSTNIMGVTQALSGSVLLAVYFAADNDLDSEINYVLQRLRLGTTLNPNVRVLFLVDGGKDGDTRLLEIFDGQMTPTGAIPQLWGTAELDTADPAVLSWFLQYARRHEPAELTVVALLGHGLPPTPDLTWASPPLTVTASSQPATGIPPLPKEHEASPSDLTNNSFMSTVDVGEALMAATDNGANPFDLLFFDQCFQGSLDVLYEVHQTARVFVASPNYAWLAAAYTRYIAEMTPTATPEAIAQDIINIYWRILDRRHPNSIFWVRGADIPVIAAAVSNLGDALSRAVDSGRLEPIRESARRSLYVDTTQCGLGNLHLGPPDELIGAETFARNLQVGFPAGDSDGVYQAAESLLTALQGVSNRSIVGNPYLARDETWAYTDTFTLLAPLPRDSPSDVAWRASLYRSDTPFAAEWTIDPTQSVSVTTSLAYVRDGRWDEFLAKWYTNLTPTVGQWCNYMPPDQLTIADAQPLTLTATLSGSAVLLNWTPTDDVTATEYWLYAERPYDVGWTRRKDFPLGQTSALFTAEDAGDYRFAMLARNEDFEYVAQSNEVTVQVPPDPIGNGPYKVFLPQVNR